MSVYYGVKPIKGKKPATAEQALKANQIRLWGLKEIPQDIRDKIFNDKKDKKEKIKLLGEIFALKGKINRLKKILDANQDISNPKKAKIREDTLKEIDKINNILTEKKMNYDIKYNISIEKDNIPIIEDNEINEEDNRELIKLIDIIDKKDNDFELMRKQYEDLRNKQKEQYDILFSTEDKEIEEIKKLEKERNKLRYLLKQDMTEDKRNNLADKLKEINEKIIFKRMNLGRLEKKNENMKLDELEEKQFKEYEDEYNKKNRMKILNENIIKYQNLLKSGEYDKLGKEGKERKIEMIKELIEEREQLRKELRYLYLKDKYFLDPNFNEKKLNEYDKKILDSVKSEASLIRLGEIQKMRKKMKDDEEQRIKEEVEAYRKFGLQPQIDI